MEFTAYPRLGEVSYKWKHASGMKIFVIPKKGYQKKTALWATRYGSVDNCFKKPGDEVFTKVPDGIAHFLEHKLFEQKDESVLDKFSRLGASPNAFTSFLQTAYYFSCTEKFGENLKLLLDFVQNPWITSENVEKEKGIIGQEIRMYEDSAQWRVFFNLLDCLYEKHPVRIDIAGTIESIAGIDKEMLTECWETFYNPSNMALVIVGDVDPDEISEIIDVCVRQVESKGNVERYYPAEEQGLLCERREQTLTVSMPQFLMGIRDEAGLSGIPLLRRRTALEIAMDAWIGRSSTLYNELYDLGLINDSFGADVTIEQVFGFILWGGQSPEPDKTAEHIGKSLLGLVRDGLDNEAFNRVRKAHEGHFIRSLNSTERLSRSLIDCHFAGADFFNLAEIYASITKDEINIVLKEVFSKPFALSVIRPRSEADSAQDAI